MSEYAIIEDPLEELWNGFLAKFPEGNFEQCYEYGEISKNAFPRTRVVRLAALHNGRIVGVIQGTYSKYFGFGMTLGIMRGPLIDVKCEDKSGVIEALLRALEEYARKNRIIKAQIIVPESWRVEEVFQSLGYKMADRLNEYVVNLEGGIDDLWRSFSHNKRRNIKKAIKEGVEVFQSRNYEDLLSFYSMLRAAERRGGFSSYPLSWFEAVWKVYAPGLSRVFLARWKGREVSGVFTVIHGNTVYALAAGSFSEGWKVRPNDIMHWKVMEWASHKGYSAYHMGLLSEPPPTRGSSAWGIWRWKREWKGTLAKLQIFHKLFMPKYSFLLEAKKLAGKGYKLFKFI